MGTRHDWYIGRGPDAEWIGSGAWDGYPDGHPPELLAHTDADEYRTAVTGYLTGKDDGTLPHMGWPWPWDNSGTTDYAYAFDGGVVYGSCFGGPWFIASAPPDDEDEDGNEIEPSDDYGVPNFPDMSDRKSVVLQGKRSGLMVIRMSPDGISISDDEVIAG